MINDRTRSEFDQGAATVSKLLPSLWRQLFLGCVAQGFTKSQAFELLKEYIRIGSGVSK